MNLGNAHIPMRVANAPARYIASRYPSFTLFSSSAGGRCPTLQNLGLKTYGKAR